MVSRFTAGARSLAIDVIPAAMMGGAVATLVMLAPVELLERLVIRSHLASLLHAARPPLGLTARGAIATAAFAGVSVAVVALMRVAGRVGRAVPSRRIDGAPVERSAPTLRRADRHPDAPARRPIFAALDLATDERPEAPLSFEELSVPRFGRGSRGADPVAEPAPSLPDPVSAAPIAAPEPAFAPPVAAVDAAPRWTSPREAVREDSVAALLARLERQVAGHG